MVEMPRPLSNQYVLQYKTKEERNTDKKKERKKDTGTKERKKYR
jgi:hypothetical protein